MFVLLSLFLQLNAVAAELRIVSLHPAITEDLFAMGLGPNIVGTTEYSDYPDDAKKIPRVGGHRFSIEKIISLHPTHIVTITDRTGISSALADKAKVKIIKVNFEDLNDFLPAIQKLGIEFNQAEGAKKVAAEWESAWARFKPVTSSKEVVIQVQTDPIVVTGKETFLDTILSKCGVKNAIDKTGYPTLNREALFNLKPSRVVLLLTDLDDATKEKAAKLWQNVSKRTKLSFFDPNTISKLTPRLPSEAKRFCESLQ